MKLEVNNLSCGYRKGKTVIRDISFDMHDGDICCILGPNGVGKSTLFKSILKMLPVLEGNICIDGCDIAKWNNKKVAQVMAYVAQSHIPPFPYRVKDIIMLGRVGGIGALGQPKKRDYEIVEQILEELGIRHLKNKIYTDISGGERQLLLIGKALAQEPKIMILDEPTANLDYGNMVMVMKMLNKLASKGLMILFTTHLPDQAFMCNAKTLFLLRNEAFIFGEGPDVVTEENLKKAYHTDIHVLESMDEHNRRVRVCVPRMV